MPRISNKQIALKPQDLYVLLKLAVAPQGGQTFAALGKELGMAASQIHASYARALASRLLSRSLEEIRLDRRALREFVLHGARYVFPASLGATTRGLPTSYAASPLKELITQTEDPPPVWPFSAGEAKGISLIPLYPTAPAAALRDPKFYEVLSLFDALRSGAAREREIAHDVLERTI